MLGVLGFWGAKDAEIYFLTYKTLLHEIDSINTNSTSSL